VIIDFFVFVIVALLVIPVVLAALVGLGLLLYIVAGLFTGLAHIFK